MCERRSPRMARRVLVPTVIGFAMTILALPVPALAQHRARLATDLAQDIKQSGSIHVLLEGSQSEVDRIVQTYHLRVIKRISSGAVLEGTGHQFDLVANDAGVTTLQEDNKVKGTALVGTGPAGAITPEATGADQLWAGNGTEFGGDTGRDITVAVIDSGISDIQGDLKNRVLHWED